MTQFFPSKDKGMQKLANEIWKKIEHLERDDVERLLAALFQKNYHLAPWFSHKEGGRIPKILRKKIDKEERETMLAFEYPLGDHWGAMKTKDGHTLAVLEPYGIELEQLEELTKFCRANGLRVCIDGASQHFVGRACRVMFEK